MDSGKSFHKSSAIPREVNVVSATGFSKRVSALRRTTSLSALFPVILALAVAAAPAAQAQTFNLVYGFTGGADGGGPNYLTVDSAGNLYGVASNGGAFNIDSTWVGFEWSYGTLFKVNQKGAQTVLHTFTGGADGAQPNSVIRDKDGNLYGTTNCGGDFGCDSGGYGVVFKFSKGGRFSVLHAFTGAPDGQWPKALVQDSAGNLYGSTTLGGQYGHGTLFKIDVKGNETVLYTFTGGSDGMYLSGNLLLDSSGNLYGTAGYSGSGGGGTVFKFNLTSGTFTTLYSFTGGTDGALPFSLVMDSSGNLYGNAMYGGAHQAGTLYKITPTGLFSVVYTFTGGDFTGRKDGGSPWGPLALDAAGNLYGTTFYGGLNDSGVVFKVNPSSGQETVLYGFRGFVDGAVPNGVVMDEAGDLYGTAGEQGPFVGISNLGVGGGTVFKITP